MSFCCKEKQTVKNNVNEENACLTTLKREFRAKSEKKSESFWQNEIRTLVLIIDLG